MIPIINETKGVRLIGPLPGELQRYQVYVAAPMSAARSPEAARSFVAFLTGSGGEGGIFRARSGMRREVRCATVYLKNS